MPDVEIAALADSNPDCLQSIADQFGVKGRYESHLALVDDDSLDAIVVSTPPSQHFEHAGAALQRGRHVLVEAPLALSAEHCDQLVALASRSDVVATVGTNLRHHPMIERAGRCVREGWIGPVQAISATFTTPSRGQRGDVFPAWRQPDTLEGCVFTECAVQHFDAWRDLVDASLDEISVQCASEGGPTSLSATMGGSIVVGAVFSEYSGDHCEIRLLGRDGALTLSLYRFNGFDYCASLVPQGSPRQYLRAAVESLRALPRGLRIASAGGEYTETFKRQLRVFINAIRAGTAPVVSFEDGSASARAALAAFESMRSGRRVAP